MYFLRELNCLKISQLKPFLYLIIEAPGSWGPCASHTLQTPSYAPDLTNYDARHY